jgi:hypothetical protein
VMETYGKSDQHHYTVHLGQGDSRVYHDASVPVAGLRNGFHTYGILLEPDWLTIYRDRKAIARHPMIESFRQEVYPQLTLSVDGRETGGTNPMTLLIDYVRVWKKA